MVGLGKVTILTPAKKPEVAWRKPIGKGERVEASNAGIRYTCPTFRYDLSWEEFRILAKQRVNGGSSAVEAKPKAVALPQPKKAVAAKPAKTKKTGGVKFKHPAPVRGHNKNLTPITTRFGISTDRAMQYAWRFLKETGVNPFKAENPVCHKGIQNYLRRDMVGRVTEFIEACKKKTTMERRAKAKRLYDPTVRGFRSKPMPVQPVTAAVGAPEGSVLGDRHDL